MPLPAGVQVEENEGARMFREREERQAEKERKEREGAGKPKREDWMLVPPKEMDLMSCSFPSLIVSFSFPAQMSLPQPSTRRSSSLAASLPERRRYQQQRRRASRTCGRKRLQKGSNG
jgi:hypothetical protein